MFCMIETIYSNSIFIYIDHMEGLLSDGRHGGISCGWNHCISCDTRVFYGASRITSFTEQLHHTLVFIYGLNGMFNALQGNPLPIFLKLYWLNKIHGF